MSDDGWRRVWRNCERCGGTGGPPSRFDEDTHRWEHYVCGSCGGDGAGWTWVQTSKTRTRSDV